MKKKTGEPVIFTNVYFYKTSIGAATDVMVILIFRRFLPASTL